MQTPEYWISIEPNRNPVPSKTGNVVYDVRLKNAAVHAKVFGNAWAWGVITVHAEWRGMVGTSEPLTDMPFDGEDDFKASSFYHDLQREARENLEDKIRDVMAYFD
jgi:hypothetical protein